MRVCSECGLEQCLDSFPFRNKAKGIRQNICKPCTRDRSAAWFKSNRERHAKTSAVAQKKWRKKKRAELYLVVNALKEPPCMDCGEQHNSWVMQFDHRDGSSKVGDVATMVHELKPIDLILEEIAKCDLVCANCHAERTYRRRNPIK